jgi:hypothetical protein
MLISAPGARFPRAFRGASSALLAPAGSPLARTPAGVERLPLQSTLFKPIETFYTGFFKKVHKKIVLSCKMKVTTPTFKERTIFYVQSEDY